MTVPTAIPTDPLRWASTLADAAPRARTSAGPCHHCLGGDHDLCTGVGCYRCSTPHRTHGCASVGDGMQGGTL